MLHPASKLQPALQPVSTGAFNAAMQQALAFDQAAPVIAAAVSGGGDSMALALLLKEWAGSKGSKMIALVVDHGLRAESAQEAQTTAARLKSLGIDHEILSWQGEKPTTSIQEQARQGRYRLLLEACHRHSASVLALAHNAEDQIETFWMRLVAGSGPDGLAAMAPARMQEGILQLRPLLSFTRAQLRDTCRARGAEWIEDPSNTNEKFLRVKLRGFEDLLTQEGLTPARLSRSLQKIADARVALDWATGEAAASCLSVKAEGYITLNQKTFATLPADIQRRVLALALASFACNDAYAPSHEAIEDIRRDLLKPGFAGRTLASCDIAPLASGDVIIAREEAAAQKAITLREGAIWDGRFIFHGFGESFQVGIITDTGFEKLRKQNEAIAAQASRLPLKVRRTLPGLYDTQGELVSIPHLSYYGSNCPPAGWVGKILLSPHFGAKLPEKRQN